MLQDYFYYSRSERVAALTLVILILFFFGLNSYLYWRPNSEPPLKMEVLLLEQDKVDSLAPEEIVLAPFDPNLAEQEELEQLGLSARTARSIINYRSKGGKYRYKEDLAKIYTLDSADYIRLKPYIQLPGRPANFEPYKRKKKRQKRRPKFDRLEINSANEQDWQELRGIGPGYARRIVKFRKALGGFYKIEQVAELYGLPDSTYQKIKGKLHCRPHNIKKINLNTATEEELKSHPYLNWKQAKAIVRWREEQEPFDGPHVLQTLFEFDDGSGNYERLLPYLSW